jgi:hypothetical protein
MKTTVDLPDDLLIAAKKQAAEERRPLRELLEEGLRTVLQPAGRKRVPSAIRWVTVRGGLPEGVDVADRDAMHDRLKRRS